MGSDYGAKYEIPDETMRSEDSIREGEDGRRDLLTSPGISGEEARTQPADTFATLYETTEVGTIPCLLDSALLSQIGRRIEQAVVDFDVRPACRLFRPPLLNGFFKDRVMRALK